MKFWRLSKISAVVVRLSVDLLILYSLLWLWENTFRRGALFNIGGRHQQTNSVVFPRLPKIVFRGNDEESRGDRLGRADLRVANATGSRSEQACRVPKVDINGSDVVRFYEKPRPLNCEKNEENWAYVDSDTKFRISEKAQKKYANIQCSLSSFERVNDDKLKTGKAILLKPGDPITGGDFAQVDCTTNSNKTWSHLLWTIVPNENRVQQLSAIERNQDWSGLDVYFIGYDSLSQMAFRRNLPETVKFLEQKLQSVVLNGYNIVGDGTPQAFIPILTGYTEEELPLTRKRFPDAHYVDEVYPFAWKNFSDAGYATLYGEDAARVGTFTYRLKGFKQQPTDHYIRTFFQRAENFYKNINCIGSVPMHKDWFRYTSEFMARYPANIPKFLVAFHGRLSHDHITQVQVADADTAEHLRALHSKGLLDKAVVIVMADHGHRFAKFRETHQGQLEERLPFFSISLPKAFRESQRGKLAFQNLQRNKNRLTTPFDIHATLMDILHWPSDQLLSTPNELTNRSMSLFREVPLARTCSHAGIPAHFCACLQRQSAMRSTSQHRLSVQLARAVVRTINDYTEKERSLCSQIDLFFVEDAQQLIPDESMLKYKKAADKDGYVADLSGNAKVTFSYYQLKFWTTPGNSLFEATVKYEPSTDTVTVELTSISHINAYGDLPHCIIDKNYFLAAYCVCYDKIAQ